MSEQQVAELTQRIDNLAANLAPPINLRPFNGEIGDDWMRFIEKFELYARSKNLSDERRALILPTYLDSLALAKYRALPSTIKEPGHYSDLLKELTKALVPSNLAEYYSTALQSRRQRQGESISNFFTAIQTLLVGAYPNMEQDQTDAYNRMLLAIFKKWNK